MGNIGPVLRFGAQYLRRYWPRFVTGLVLGILFGLTTASFVWATKVMIGRMTPETTQATPAEINLSPTNTPAPAVTSGMKTEARAIKLKLAGLKAKAEVVTNEFVDPWLPKMGRPIDWRQFLGGLLF